MFVKTKKVIVWNKKYGVIVGHYGFNRQLETKEDLQNWTKFTGNNLLVQDFKDKAKDLEFVTLVAKGKFIKGTYTAHEYCAEVNGKARLIKYSNGQKEVEVKCLDKFLKVADGFWKFDGSFTNFSNRCGDDFNAHAVLSI